MRIRISWGRGQVVIRLLDNDMNRRLVHTLPYRGQARCTAGEVTVRMPVFVDPTDIAPSTVATVYYRSQAQSLVIPLEGARCTGCCPIGQLETDATALAPLRDGDGVHVSVLGE